MLTCVTSIGQNSNEITWGFKQLKELGFIDVNCKRNSW